MDLKLGTRKSLLALAQSTWVARAVEAANPGVSVHLVGIETKGDQILDKPLSEIEGKEFFTAELDHALLRGDVDFTVHSFKDLALDRPPQFKIAAVPVREFPHDIVFFSADGEDRIRQGQPLRIGTSSPRRNKIIPKFLAEHLPQISPQGQPTLQFVSIRGNINTRFGRILLPAKDSQKLDAVILAFAGVERLIQSPEHGAAFKEQVLKTRKMILPIFECPTAPAQGALAVEAKTENKSVLGILEKIHDPNTRLEIEEERQELRQWGGGCHLALGATVFYGQGLSTIYVDHSNRETIRQEFGRDFQNYFSPKTTDVFEFESLPLKYQTLDGPLPILISHQNALQSLDLFTGRIWVAGSTTWKAAAQKGIWVEGSLEGQGESNLSRWFNKKTLAATSWRNLTHKDALKNSIGIGVATYAHKIKKDAKFNLNESHYFWKSGSLFLAYLDHAEKLGQGAEFRGKIHACGKGKTASLLRSLNIPFQETGKKQ